ncbi:M3 family metallopeptidase [Solitalea koreensis]|uniref:Thimet oligopeptidase n=1 Tax=Solitalea koreensis TaxID=543615 RepID=A0A521DD56_9SPHI|nr:M3 family metallopeptidase [Solitalea koreensis]SMO69535.1 thimet oligopeptidase [Solitalea koreensis]
MHLKPFVLTAFMALATNGFAQTITTTNPLLVHSNAPIQFDNVNANVIQNAVSSVIAASDARVKAIIAVPKNGQTVSNTLMAADELQYNISDLSIKLGLISSTYADDKTRNAANDQNEVLSLYATNLYLNEGLYKALKQYAGSADAKQLHPNQEKFLRETILTFEKNGMKLDAKGRKELEAINKKLIDLGTQFDKNIAESKDSIEFSADDLKGIPANTIAPWKRANGKYMVYVNGPNYTALVYNSPNEATRRSMYQHYNNRAYPQNIKVLDSLFYYRNVLALKLGFKSFAEYALVDKMAATPANVWKFENDLVAKLTPHVTEQLNELKQLKKQLNPELSDTFNYWDLLYYQKQLLDTKYQLNTDEVKQYFEMNNTIKGMFSVYEKLFNIGIKEVTNVPKWYSKVKTYEMFKDGKKIGSFYLDLYPRPNKYTHFACFPINQYRIADGKEVLPVSALICNFPEGNANEPSLLNHSDVITMFHEFGHLVHSMLGRSDIAAQGPFNVKGDFTEAPSQFLENWCWEYESLKMLARNYKTGAQLPESLFNKMKKAQNVSSAIFSIRQVYLGTLDLTYEDKYENNKDQSIVQVDKNLFTSMMQMPYPEGSHFICSFGHLNGYAANYYGYLWSKVFAQDMFSVFQKNGVMDTKTGVKYRKEILEKASTIEEMDMLRNFLGREPNSEAFLKSLGIQ